MMSMQQSFGLAISLCLTLTNCMTPSKPSQNATSETCLQYYEKVRSRDTAYFAGYGAGLNDAQAVTAARIDLAGQITTVISSTSKLAESNHDLTFNSETTATTEGLFLGFEVVKRCHNPANKMEAVVRLNKHIFLSNLKKEIDIKLARAEHYLKIIRQNENAFLQVKALADSKAFLKDVGKTFEQQWAICQTFQYCPFHSTNPFLSLSDEVFKQQERIQFQYEPVNHYAKENQEQLFSLLHRCGYNVNRQATHESQSPRLAKASCHSRIFPATEHSNYRIAELKCHVDFTVQGKTAFFQNFIGKGIGASGDLAIQSARDKLEAASF